MAKNKVLNETRGANNEGSIFRAVVTIVGLEALPLELIKMANTSKKLCMDESERKSQKNCLKSVDEFEAILMK